MRAFVLSTLAAVALSLGVSSTASADWRFRERVCFEHGRRVVYQDRYWGAPFYDSAPVAIAPPVDFAVPGFAGYAPGYRHDYYRPYRHYHPYHHYHR